MTFSILARCAVTGRFAVAVASSSPAVAARCAFARAGIGAVTTQNITDPRLGPQGLDLMQRGASAEQACAIVRQTAPHGAFRQFTVTRWVHDLLRLAFGVADRHAESLTQNVVGMVR